MTDITLIEPAFAALDTCNGVLGELDARCCNPSSRSQRFAEAAQALNEARVKLRAATVAPETAGPTAVAALEDAGAKVGLLQVGCCAVDRMPLYAEILENLVTARLTLRRALGT